MTWYRAVRAGEGSCGFVRKDSNSCGKVRNSAPDADNPTSYARPRSSAKYIRKDARSIPVYGIEPASASAHPTFDQAVNEPLPKRSPALLVRHRVSGVRDRRASVADEVIDPVGAVAGWVKHPADDPPLALQPTGAANCSVPQLSLTSLRPLVVVAHLLGADAADLEALAQIRVLHGRRSGYFRCRTSGRWRSRFRLL